MVLKMCKGGGGRANQVLKFTDEPNINTAFRSGSGAVRLSPGQGHSLNPTGQSLYGFRAIHRHPGADRPRSPRRRLELPPGAAALNEGELINA